MAIATEPAQTIVTLDLEGVLIPEVWIAVAEATGIEALRRTTRDEPDYDVLMGQRLAILAENDLSMSRIETVIAGLSPLPGARDFLDRLRDMTQALILSDTFEQFGRPFMRQLGMPTLLCHRLIVDDDRDIRSLLADYLESNGYRALAAADGLAMWKLLEDARPDLVVLDLNLPGMNGVELVLALRRLQPQLRMVMITAALEETLQARQTDLHGVTLLAKPFNLEALETALFAN